MTESMQFSSIILSSVTFLVTVFSQSYGLEIGGKGIKLLSVEMPIFLFQFFFNMAKHLYCTKGRIKKLEVSTEVGNQRDVTQELL